MKRPVSPADLDWPTALAAAQQIVRTCEDARFTAPELIGQRLAYVAGEMSRIAAALKLITPDGAS